MTAGRRRSALVPLAPARTDDLVRLVGHEHSGYRVQA